MTVYYGMVKGNSIILLGDAQLAEASIVEIRLPELDQVPEEVREEAYLQYLLATGRISAIPKRGSCSSGEDFEPIEVKGKPLSEIIIEERR